MIINRIAASLLPVVLGLSVFLPTLAFAEDHGDHAQCLKDAVITREDTIISAMRSHSDTVITAREEYKNDLLTALDIEDRDERRRAIEAAQQDFKEVKKEARDSYRSAIREARAEFREDRKECREQHGEDDSNDAV